MAEWQTHRTQNAAGNRVGSSPTAATTFLQIFGSAFFFVVTGVLIWEIGIRLLYELFVEI